MENLLPRLTIATVFVLMGCGQSPVLDWGPSPEGGLTSVAPSPDRQNRQDAGNPVDAATLHEASMPTCVPGLKLCGGACVAIDDPAFGCGPATCDACALSGAAATCSASSCTPLACAVGRADCDGLAANGCEVVLAAERDHCGTCGNACSAPELCNQGACAIACTAGLTNCSGSCVNVATDGAHCGSCDVACLPVANGTATCEGARCLSACNVGYHACNGQCVSSASIGSCGGACTACSAPVNATPTCNGVSCDFICNAGTTRAGGGCITTPPATDAGGPICIVTAANAAAYSTEYFNTIATPNPVACMLNAAACLSLPNSCCYQESGFPEQLCVPRL